MLLGHWQKAWIQIFKENILVSGAQCPEPEQSVCFRLTRKPGNSLLRHILPPVLPSGYLGCDDGNNQPCYIFGCRTRCRNCVCKKCRITFGDWHVLGNLCLTSKEHGYDDVNESETSFKLLNWVTFRYLV